MRVLLNEQQLSEGVAAMAEQINAHYGQTPLTIIGVLTGCLVLLADLIRQLRMPLRLGVIQASSYRGATERGELNVSDQWTPDISRQHVLLLDDIFDTGHTLHAVLRQMQAVGPASLASAVLLRKSGRQEVELEPEFVAFTIPDEFVVGYGLDYCDEYRNLPYVAVLEPSDLRDAAP